MTSFPIFVPGNEVREFGPDNTYRWATVTDTDPLRVRLDGDVDGLPLTPDTLVAPRDLTVGSRVWVQLFGRRLLILGRGGGQVGYDTAWIAPTLTHSWVDYGASWPGAGYRMGRDGRVHLRGLVKNGTAGISTPIFTLPEGYRPEGTASTGELFIQSASVSGGTGYVRVDVCGDGKVSVIGYGPSASNAHVSLAGVSFYPTGT